MNFPVNPELSSPPFDVSEAVESPLDPAAVAASEPFVGRWHRLVSQTNWEKGRIIAQWRESLIASGASVTAYSDESWARQVGAVTSQHVGRLRRVFEKFGESFESYAGLFWSHFLAAMDWDDAELWLEGAARSEWSVSQMRRMRWEAMGGEGQDQHREEDLIASEVDDGFVSLVEDEEDESTRGKFDGEGSSGPLAEGPDFGDADEHRADAPQRIGAADGIDGEDLLPPVQHENPFAALGKLPDDVSEALEQFKLSIIRHRSASWDEIPQARMLAVLDALRAFASQ
jgi:hypothetical protein